MMADRFAMMLGKQYVDYPNPFERYRGWGIVVANWNPRSRVSMMARDQVKQQIPIFNLFKNLNVNIGDGIYYSQQKRENIGDLIMESLEKFEICGGEDSFINIKYMVPTYESVLSRV